MRYDFDEIFETGKDGKMSCKIDPELTKNDSDYEFTFHKILREISNENKKILDDWCKAYLAKQYQLGENIHPGNFTLEQRQVNDPNQVGWDYKLVPNDQNLGFGERVKWVQCKECLPEEDLVVLCYCPGIDGQLPGRDWMDSDFCIGSHKGGCWKRIDNENIGVESWMKIPDIPDLPRPMHFCSSGSLNQDVCIERDGKLFLTSILFPNKEIQVQYCPFCGEHFNKIVNPDCVNGDESCSQKGNDGVY